MKRHAAATERNRGPIAEVLADVLPERGTLLEVASGGSSARLCAAAGTAFHAQPTTASPSNGMNRLIPRPLT